MERIKIVEDLGYKLSLPDERIGLKAEQEKQDEASTKEVGEHE